MIVYLFRVVLMVLSPLNLWSMVSRPSLEVGWGVDIEPSISFGVHSTLNFFEHAWFLALELGFCIN